MKIGPGATFSCQEVNVSGKSLDMKMAESLQSWHAGVSSSACLGASGQLGPPGLIAASDKFTLSEDMEHQLSHLSALPPESLPVAIAYSLPSPS